MTSQDRLPASVEIDTGTPEEIVRIIHQEDQKAVDAITPLLPRIAHAIDSIADRLAHGGRLFYAGAGTSGRIALLDAAELPPTFGTSPDLVQVILAGGADAFQHAVEGAEDDEEAAIGEVRARVKADDAVIGIAASGTTPFTVAAIRGANMLGALTLGITSEPASPLAREADIAIVAETGPEVIMGSTRMKSGTAQKMILNMISTGVMIRLGRVYSNLMVEMSATNEKLRRRAARMVEVGADVDPALAGQALAAAGGEIKTAILIARHGISADEARQRLAQLRGDLRKALAS